MSLTIQEMRKQALSLLLNNRKEEEYLPIDYAIDMDLRDVLNLPLRPEGQKPYVGWIVGVKKPATQPRKTSQTGLALVKRYEGLRTNAYLCPANVWTIGYGLTLIYVLLTSGR